MILPPKKNYIPQFLKQREINSYFASKVPIGDLRHIPGRDWSVLKTRMSIYRTIFHRTSLPCIPISVHVTCVPLK
jgi:hypothetical protein